MKILHPLWIIPVVTEFILPLFLPWISLFLRSSPWLVLRLETLDSLWMWTVISMVWKVGLHQRRRNLICESRFPNPLDHSGHWAFLWKSHGMPDNWWLVVKMHCSGSLLITLSGMVLRRHCFSSLLLLEPAAGFQIVLMVWRMFGLWSLLFLRRRELCCAGVASGQAISCLCCLTINAKDLK